MELLQRSRPNSHGCCAFGNFQFNNMLFPEKNQWVVGWGGRPLLGRLLLLPKLVVPDLCPSSIRRLARPQAQVWALGRVLQAREARGSSGVFQNTLFSQSS